MTDLDRPAAALAGCTVFHSVTIHYPVRDVPDYEHPDKRPLRPREVKIYATKHNAGLWQLSSPLVIGREILKSGALGSVERARSTVTGYWPDWLGDVTRSVRKALEAGGRAVTPDVQAAADRVRAYLYLTEAPDPIMGDLRTLLAALDPAEAPIGHVPTRAGLDYLAIRRRQHPRGGEGT